MDQLQKLVLFEKCKWPDYNSEEPQLKTVKEQADSLSRLFQILDEHEVEYHSLSLSILDLRIMDFVLPDKLPQFVEYGYQRTSLFNHSINFDIVIPSLHWVFNIRKIIETDPTKMLEQLVKQSVQEAKKTIYYDGDNDTLSRQIVFDNISDLSVPEIIEKAVSRKLKKLGLEYPYANNVSLRPNWNVDTYEMTFSDANFAALESLLNKKC